MHIDLSTRSSLVHSSACLLVTFSSPPLSAIRSSLCSPLLALLFAPQKLANAISIGPAFGSECLSRRKTRTPRQKGRPPPTEPQRHPQKRSAVAAVCVQPDAVDPAVFHQCKRFSLQEGVQEAP